MGCNSAEGVKYEFEGSSDFPETPILNDSSKIDLKSLQLH